MFVKFASSRNNLNESGLSLSWIFAKKFMSLSSEAKITGLIISMLITGSACMPGIKRERVTLSAETRTLDAEKSAATERPSIFFSDPLSSVLKPLTS